MTAFRTARGVALRWQLTVNDEQVSAAEGESVAAALLASGRWTFRRDEAGAPRGPFCLMGVCQECLVEIDGTPNRRACLVPVVNGMRIYCG